MYVYVHLLRCMVSNMKIYVRILHVSLIYVYVYVHEYRCTSYSSCCAFA